jgi:hypothetical protein
MRGVYLLAAILASFPNLVAQATPPPAASSGFQTAAAILSSCAAAEQTRDYAFCMGYLEGAADAAGGHEINGFRPCIPGGVEGSRLKLIAVDLIRVWALAHPNYNAASIAIAAYGLTFPCPKISK